MGKIFLLLSYFLLSYFNTRAGEANLVIPKLDSYQFNLLIIGLFITLLGMLFGIFHFLKVKKYQAHKSMLEIGEVIYQTCKAYLKQQGKFLTLLFFIVGVVIAFYFGALQNNTVFNIIIILLCTIIGILGSYSVAWFGMRINTLSNSRMAFASLKKHPIDLYNIPINAGMSIGLMLISIELAIMLIILLFIPRELAGPCFIGFAIGESLGASALRIAGGIFTKIADIGSDLMKVFFKIKEDDPRNPGVIADCTGDNAGDSVGPTADGFETYGVTGVALITFIVLAVKNLDVQKELLTWIFLMRILMLLTSSLAFFINKFFSKIFLSKEEINFEKPLSSLVWITSVLSIIVTFIVSYIFLGKNSVSGNISENLWLSLSIIISCGTLGAALIPEFTRFFTSSKSTHVKEITKSSEKGGASLNILTGFIAGNYSAFWQGMVFVVLMLIAYIASSFGLNGVIDEYQGIFAFGLVAFGFLSMGPVTIAVDSYGPVTDNAQSIYELSLIEAMPNIDKEIEKEFGFKPNFEKSKYYLEANDGTGNVFKATAKPVLIGTAVVGATIMIFSIILVIKKVLGIDPISVLNLLNPWTLLGFIAGGAVIYWFTGAANQAVSTGAFKAVDYIKNNINLDPNASLKASTESSKEVVRICTLYAQKGMINIFIAIFSFALGFAFLSATTVDSTDPQIKYAATSFFVSYLISIAIFGLFQAVFMANAGGAWDNAKKIVEVDMNLKGTDLHAATVIGDTVGDPFKDTASVSLNPIIKFTTLFGLLAMEIAITPNFMSIAPFVGIIFIIIALIFVRRSFYNMTIPKN